MTKTRLSGKRQQYLTQAPRLPPLPLLLPTTTTIAMKAAAAAEETLSADAENAQRRPLPQQRVERHGGQRGRCTRTADWSWCASPSLSSR